MSLKLFHILFIFFAALAALVFGIWGLLTDSATAENRIQMLGAISSVVGAGLVVYGVWFARVKSKKIHL